MVPGKQKSTLGGRRKRGLFPRLAAGILLLAALGGAWPHVMARRLPRPSARSADAVFVLTGGENRIAAGYRAWREGVGREFYILGAARGLRPEQLLPGRPALSAADAARIHVEGWSENTLENAISAKSVAASRGFRNVVLVTSDYHLPRAFLAVRKFLPPDVALSAISVPSAWNGAGAAVRSLRRFFVEGWKYWVYRIFLLGE